MRSIPALGVVAMATVVLLLSLLSVETGHAEPGVTLSLTGPSDAVGVGTEVVVTVMVSNVSDLYGAELGLTFDATLLQVKDADDEAGNGIQVSPGDLLGAGFQGENAADNAAGTVRFGASLVNPAPAINGGGGLLEITFVTQGAGVAPVSLTEAILSDTDGQTILANRDPETVDITIVDTGVFRGRVFLQGRSTYAGGVVWAGSSSAGTAADGSFSLTAAGGASYTVRTEMPRYLDAEKRGLLLAMAQTVGLATVTLPGGDANDDGVINILDLAIIGSAFGSAPAGGKWDARADINDDGLVNVLDLSITGGNFGRSEPVTWP